MEFQAKKKILQKQKERHDSRVKKSSKSLNSSSGAQSSSKFSRGHGKQAKGTTLGSHRSKPSSLPRYSDSSLQDERENEEESGQIGQKYARRAIVSNADRYVESRVEEDGQKDVEKENWTREILFGDENEVVQETAFSKETDYAAFGVMEDSGISSGDILNVDRIAALIAQIPIQQRLGLEDDLFLGLEEYSWGKSVAESFQEKTPPVFFVPESRVEILSELDGLDLDEVFERSSSLQNQSVIYPPEIPIDGKGAKEEPNVVSAPTRMQDLSEQLLEFLPVTPLYEIDSDLIENEAVLEIQLPSIVQKNFTDLPKANMSTETIGQDLHSSFSGAKVFSEDKPLPSPRKFRADDAELNFLLDEIQGSTKTQLSVKDEPAQAEQLLTIVDDSELDDLLNGL